MLCSSARSCQLYIAQFSHDRLINVMLLSIPVRGIFPVRHICVNGVIEFRANDEMAICIVYNSM